MREFVRGALTNPDPAVRKRALQISEEAVDVAQRLGAPTVKLWPGQDGFDYPFQADYRELWKLAVDGVRTVAEMDERVRVAIEYKTKEPRTHLSWSTAARTLLGIAQTGRDDVGIVMDLGHSLFAKEAPADALSLVHEHGRLYTIEVNDNWREWDDDLAVGSIHLIETLEFFLEVRKIGWDEPIFLDQFPFREDPVEAARTSINTIRAIDAALDRIDLDALRDAQARQDALAAQRDPDRAAARTMSRRGPRDERGRRRASANPPASQGERPSHRRGAGRAGRGGDGAGHDLHGSRRGDHAGGRPAFDPQQYGEETYPKAVSTLEENAQPLPELVAALAKDADAAGEQYGNRAGNSPYAFPVTVEGVAGKAKDGTLPVKVKGVPKDVTVSVQVGPALQGTAIRDAVGFIEFGQFVNQVEYADAATALNNQVKAQVLEDLDPRASRARRSRSSEPSPTWRRPP